MSPQASQKDSMAEFDPSYMSGEAWAGNYVTTAGDNFPFQFNSSRTYKRLADSWLPRAIHIDFPRGFDCFYAYVGSRDKMTEPKIIRSFKSFIQQCKY